VHVTYIVEWSYHGRTAVEEESNGGRISVESKSNRSCNHCLTSNWRVSITPTDADVNCFLGFHTWNPTKQLMNPGNCRWRFIYQMTTTLSRTRRHITFAYHTSQRTNGSFFLALDLTKSRYGSYVWVVLVPALSDDVTHSFGTQLWLCTWGIPTSNLTTSWKQNVKLSCRFAGKPSNVFVQ